MRRVLAAALILLACDSETEVDPVVPDAAAPAPDAGAPVPDALADAVVVSADLAPPDAAVVERDGAGPDAVLPPPDAAPAPPDAGPPFGGDRPATVYFPSAAPPADGWPLVLLLHGYRATSLLIDRQFGLSRRVEEDAFVLVTPDGLFDDEGAQRWNGDATGEPDDVAYLTGLVREIMARRPIDPTRVFVMGHSNGGHMAYRLACEAPDLFAGVIPVSSLRYVDPAECVAGTPLNLLHIHGDQDVAHPFEGKEGEPGVDAAVDQWAQDNHCPSPAVEEGPFDVEVATAGPETLVRRYDGCDAGTSVGRWRMQNVGHVFIFSPEGSQRLMQAILGMRRD